ncbi:MAG TPA: ribosomal protein S18-alanine N-acetyltransferase [Syntrophomonadaceae bacterium]|nr:ribosomal protein S18-alanine N-acetyltransferase [Syntrophomonadaceae bacterium]
MEEINNGVSIRFMEKGDIEEIMLIEQCSFPAPWSAKAFLNELQNKFARYFVLLKEGKVVGYAGMWLFARESHITTIAVHPNYRNQDYGRMLMNFLIDYSRQEDVDTMILEVRTSNIPAIKLYSSLGFKKIGIRKNYYLETHEDAIVMLRKLDEENCLEEDEKVAD